MNQLKVSEQFVRDFARILFARDCAALMAYDRPAHEAICIWLAWAIWIDDRKK
jgi:hypothetical protein